MCRRECHSACTPASPGRKAVDVLSATRRYVNNSLMPDACRKSTLLTRHSVSLTLVMGVKIDAALLSRETAVMLYRTSAVKHPLGGVNTSQHESPCKHIIKNASTD